MNPISLLPNLVYKEWERVGIYGAIGVSVGLRDAIQNAIGE